jgi:hypothetical protein
MSINSTRSFLLNSIDVNSDRFDPASGSGEIASIPQCYQINKDSLSESMLCRDIFIATSKSTICLNN